MTLLLLPTWSAVVGWYEAGVVLPTPECWLCDAAAQVRHVGGHTLHNKPAAEIAQMKVTYPQPKAVNPAAPSNTDPKQPGSWFATVNRIRRLLQSRCPAPLDLR